MSGNVRGTLMPLLFVVAFAAPTIAQSRVIYLNGNELHEMCQVDRLSCAGYVMGVADALEAIAWPSPRSCRPKSVVAEQLIDLAIKTVKESPAERHRPAFDLIADEVVRLWPC